MFKIEKHSGNVTTSPWKGALYGKQGCGKTFTALWLAEDLAKRRGGKILLIDTENGSDKYAIATQRGIHPEPFVFDVVRTRSLTEILSGLRSLPPEYAVVVIDSITHVWEAALEAWQARNPGREPALRDWGPIKRPYKELMRWIVGTACDVIVCGREKALFQDVDGKLENVGFGIKAEGETLYETDVVIRMTQERRKDGSVIPVAVVEKDRWGILSGRSYAMPTPAMIQPIYPFLGTTAPAVENEEERAEADSVLLDEADDKAAAKVAKSAAIMADMQALIATATDPVALGKAQAEIKRLKRSLTEEHLGALRVLYDARRATVAGAAMPEV